MPANADFNTIATTTLRDYRPELSDQITGHQAILAQLREKEFIDEIDGGRSIVEPLLTDENDAATSFHGYDLLPVAPQEGISAAEYLMKQLVVPVTISGREEWENSGSRTMIINLLDSKLMQARITLSNQVNSQIFSDGSGNGGKDITGLAAAVEDGLVWGMYGGIDSSVAGNSFWRNVWVDFDATNTSFGTTSGSSVEGMNVLRNTYNSASYGTVKPTLGVTTQALFEAYEKHGEGSKLELTDTTLLDMGFQTLSFKGIPIVWDEDCTTNTWFWLTAEHMRFKIGKGKNFVVTPFQTPYNQESSISHIILYAQITLNKRKAQARIGDFVPTP